MKKIAIASLIALATSFASAADYVSLDVDHVKDRSTKQTSTAEYVRAGKEIGGIQYGLQSRTARYQDGSGLANSLEVTAGKSFGVVTPFVGVGHDNGFNGASGKSYNYGLVGATAGTQVGPGFALAGVKARLGSTESDMTQQTIVFGSYSVPVAKNVAVVGNLSRSYRDIRENAYGLGLNIGF